MAKANLPRKQAPAPVSQPQTQPRARVNKVSDKQNDTLVFGRQNFIFMGIGIAVMALGYILMSGGSMPSPDVWDESIIYSKTRIVLAPFLIIAGLVIEIYAIFKKSPVTTDAEVKAVETEI